MGQKVNPHGLRVGVIKKWDSRWLVSDMDFGDTIVNDYHIRDFLKKKLYNAGVPKIEIERSNSAVTVIIYCAKPGMVIGQKGAEKMKLEAEVKKIVRDDMIHAVTQRAIKNHKEDIDLQAALKAIVVPDVRINIFEVKTPDLNAQLVAESIADQLVRRIGFRRAMKNAIGRAMRLGAKGIKVACSGRLGGAEIARSEHYHEGTIPLQTLRADIEYGFAEANTTYGKIGVKVWIYGGEVLNESRSGGRRDNRDNRDRRDRRGSRDNRDNRRDNRDNRRDNRDRERKPYNKEERRDVNA
ncbi:MAG: 30S ribosomal protein S3 [Clostridia bacterium]|nr:30S ribosomal protein S3 [Clostridia bacterium]